MDWAWLFGFRANGYTKRRSKVEGALSSGNKALAATLLKKQEREWGLNWANGSPASMVVDYEHLIWVLERLQEVVPEVSATAAAALLPANGLRDINVMLVNHSLRGRMMSRDLAKKMVRLQDELQQTRRQLRIQLGAAGARQRATGTD